MQVQKSAARDCIRRRMRLFQPPIPEVVSQTRKGQAATAGNPNKEPVCEIMSKLLFGIALNAINPKIRNREVRKCIFKMLLPPAFLFTPSEDERNICIKCPHQIIRAF